MKYYKVSCEFYIKAKNQEEAEEEIINDLSYNNFMESHLIIEETKKDIAEKEGIYND